MMKASFEADIIRNEPVSHFLHHLIIQMAFKTENRQSTCLWNAQCLGF